MLTVVEGDGCAVRCERRWEELCVVVQERVCTCRRSCLYRILEALQAKAPAAAKAYRQYSASEVFDRACGPATTRSPCLGVEVGVARRTTWCSCGCACPWLLILPVAEARWPTPRATAGALTMLHRTVEAAIVVVVVVLVGSKARSGGDGRCAAAAVRRSVRASAPCTTLARS